MKIFTVLMLTVGFLSHDTHAAEKKFECSVRSGSGVSSVYTFRRDMPSAVAMGAPQSEFIETGKSVLKDQYCGRALKMKDAKLPAGTQKWKGFLLNARGSCELELDAKGVGIYRETVPSISMGGPAKIYPFEVQCKDWL